MEYVMTLNLVTLKISGGQSFFIPDILFYQKFSPGTPEQTICLKNLKKRFKIKVHHSFLAQNLKILQKLVFCTF